MYTGPMKFQFRFPVLHTRVVDGDSIHLLLDTGFGNRHQSLCRLENVDCPEKNTEAGKMVTTVMEDWVSRRDGSLEFLSSRIGKFGRPIGTIYSQSNPSETASIFLINSGLAKEYAGGRRSWGETELRLVETKCRELLS